MRVLFLGGTGIISSACSALCVARGIETHLLVRGRSHRAVPAGAVVHEADLYDDASVRAALGDLRFDAVMQFIAFTPDRIERDLDLFRDRTDQYVFISSASAYRTPPASLPVTEGTVLANPEWEYSRNKILCEERLTRAYREAGFPAVIVRPSHTYDETLLPFDHGYTVVDRMRRGKPVVVHGDGSSLWTLTWHGDFAAAFVPLLGDARTIGEAFHITSDEWLSWDAIYREVARAAGVREPELVHVASETIARLEPGRGPGLLGDKAHSMVFDNTKVKRLVPSWSCETPFARGAERVMAWFDADETRRRPDPKADAAEDLLVEWSRR